MKMNETTRMALIKWRDEQGFSNREAAISCGVQPSTFGRWVNDPGVGIRQETWQRLQVIIGDYLPTESPREIDPRLYGIIEKLNRLLAELDRPHYALFSIESDIEKYIEVFAMAEKDRSKDIDFVIKKIDDGK